MRALHAVVFLIAIVATVASAAKFMPPPQSANAALSRLAKDPPRDLEQKPAFAVRQAPVPLLWTYKHQAVAVPEEQALTANTVVIAATPGENGDRTVDPSADRISDQAVDQARMGQADARAAIEADGYKSVTDIAQAPDGRWTARALRGTTMVNLTVAADGSVSAN